MKSRLVPLAAAYLLAAGLIAPAGPLAADESAQQPAAPAEQPRPSAPSPQPSETTPAPAPPQAAAPPAGPTGEDGPVSRPVSRAVSRPVARAATPGSVTIKDFVYSPASITVSAGDKVTWTNRDTAPHSATGKGGTFDTGTFGKGKSGSHTFDKAGTFSYICSVHPNMKGTVKVVSSSSGGGGASASGGSGGSATSGSSSGGSSGGSSSKGSHLPATGLDAFFLAYLGLGLLGLGRLLHGQAAREL